MKATKLERLKLYKFIYILIGMFSLQACAMNEKQNYFELDINSEGVDYYILFNGVKVYNEVNSAPNRQLIPLNHWCRNGTNSLAIDVNFGVDSEEEKLIKSKDSKLIISLIVREKSSQGEQSYVLTKFDLSSSNQKPTMIASNSIQNIQLDSSKEYEFTSEGDIKVGAWKTDPSGSWVSFQQNIEFDSGLPEWSFWKADDLGDAFSMTDEQYYELMGELYGQYVNVWNLMKDKDINALMKLFNLRSEEFNQAYFLGANEKHDDMQRSLTSAFEHDSLYLDKLAEQDYIRLETSADGKLAVLRIDSSNEPLIYYSHKEGAFTRFYDLYFMKKDGKWIIIR